MNINLKGFKSNCGHTQMGDLVIHRSRRMTESETRMAVNYGIEQGYKLGSQIPDEVMDAICDPYNSDYEKYDDTPRFLTLETLGDILRDIAGYRNDDRRINQTNRRKNMIPTDNFQKIKQEILKRAHEAEACKGQYGRAYAAETLGDLCTVIKDNFNWCCRNGVIDAPLLEKYKEDFAGNEIYVNIDTERGFLLCDGNATVTAYGNATVTARDNATVTAWDNATVTAWDNATVTACDSATVTACDSATVRACDSATVEAYGNATVTAWDNATVEAYGNAYCTSWSLMECKLSDNALYRVRSTNTVYYANDGIKFQKQ